VALIRTPLLHTFTTVALDYQYGLRDSASAADYGVSSVEEDDGGGKVDRREEVALRHPAPTIYCLSHAPTCSTATADTP
jgi:hypothetical protein